MTTENDQSNEKDSKKDSNLRKIENLRDVQKYFAKEIKNIMKCSVEVINPLKEKESKEFSEFNEQLAKLLTDLKSGKVTVNKSKDENVIEISEIVKEDIEEDIEEDVEEEVSITNIIDVESDNEKPDLTKLMNLLTSFRSIADNSSSKTITKSLFLNIFSEFDSFLNTLLVFIFTNKSEKLSESEKNYTVSEILKYDSIEEFKIGIINKEVEDIIRKSYIEQFKVYENKFNISSLKKFNNWPLFVEITQRRNIIMHCNGKVNDQYYNNCTNHCCNISDTELNDVLEVDYDYLIMSINIIHEVGILLLHTLWRKLFPKQLVEADEALNSYIFDLLSSKEYEMATIFGAFACNQVKHSDEVSKYFYIINYCIALKKLDKMVEVDKIIRKYDWSNVQKEFLLAKLILCDELKLIPDVMKKIGTEGEYFSRETYCTFPIFSFIESNEEFKNAYTEIFEEDYELLKATLQLNEVKTSDNKMEAAV